MILGIVGHEAAKFTADREFIARVIIKEALQRHAPDLVVSGGCHLGGVDKWAREETQHLGIPFEEYLPKHLRWSPQGYQERNLKIAGSDLVLCIVVKDLPEGYKGMRFPQGCYHCKDRNPPHVKSGGCWTAWKCGKREWRIIG